MSGYRWDRVKMTFSSHTASSCLENKRVFLPARRNAESMQRGEKKKDNYTLTKKESKSRDNEFL